MPDPNKKFRPKKLSEAERSEQGFKDSAANRGVPVEQLKAEAAVGRWKADMCKPSEFAEAIADQQEADVAAPTTYVIGADDMTACPKCGIRLDALDEGNQTGADEDGPIYEVECPEHGKFRFQFDPEES